MALSLRLSDRPALAVRRLTDPADRADLARRLAPHRFNAAYALAQLDDDHFPLAEFFHCRTPRGDALVCHSRSGLGYATTLAGDPDGCAAILQLHPGYPSTFAIADPAHVPALESVYAFRQLKHMTRMRVGHDTFRPPPLRPQYELQPLLGAHVDLINRLYNAEGDPAHYRAEHIQGACYWGVVDEERLVAVAGTHAVGLARRIAILGNVFTHPRYRGRGHATAVTAAVTAALLQHADDVVLSVDPDNAPAIRAYHKLGYQVTGDIIEATAIRQSGTLITAARRWAARRRSADPDLEIVLT